MQNCRLSTSGRRNNLGMTARIFFSVLVLCLGAVSHASGQPVLGAKTAYNRGDYVAAARKLGPLARRGNAPSQALLGFMYANGLGVPQNFEAAIDLYVPAAEQGNPTAQYLLGLMYDKGQGVGQNDILAHKWLNLAAARAPRREREYYIRLRDAVASKMTGAQVAEAQSLAVQWNTKSRW
jgi:uncharacterized protein